MGRQLIQRGAAKKSAARRHRLKEAIQHFFKEFESRFCSSVLTMPRRPTIAHRMLTIAARSLSERARRPLIRS
jgi:hypothetical protein